VEEKLKKWRESNPLKLYRIKYDITAVDVAIMLNVTTNTLAAWENGAHEPSEENMWIIKSFVGLNAPRNWQKWLNDKPDLVKVR